MSKTNNKLSKQIKLSTYALYLRRKMRLKARKRLKKRTKLSDGKVYYSNMMLQAMIDFTRWMIKVIAALMSPSMS